MEKISVASLDPPTHAGWLTKQGGSIKTWKRRWMVLKGTTLYYFKVTAPLACGCASGSPLTALALTALADQKRCRCDGCNRPRARLVHSRRNCQEQG